MTDFFYDAILRITPNAKVLYRTTKIARHKFLTFLIIFLYVLKYICFFLTTHQFHDTQNLDCLYYKKANNSQDMTSYETKP